MVSFSHKRIIANHITIVTSTVFSCDARRCKICAGMERFRYSVASNSILSAFFLEFLMVHIGFVICPVGLVWILYFYFRQFRLIVIWWIVATESLVVEARESSVSLVMRNLPSLSAVNACLLFAYLC